MIIIGCDFHSRFQILSLPTNCSPQGSLTTLGQRSRVESLNISIRNGQILSVTLLEKVPILQMLEASDCQNNLVADRNQLILVDF